MLGKTKPGAGAEGGRGAGDIADVREKENGATSERAGMPNRETPAQAICKTAAIASG